MFVVKENGLNDGKRPILDLEPVAHHMNIPGLMFHAGPYTGFQTPPRKQLIHIKPKGGNEEPRSYEIQLPWVLYVASVFDGILSNIYLYASYRRITSLNSPLFRLPIPNVYDDDKFCMPPGAIPAPKTPEELFAKVLEIVWDSYYNNDLFDEIVENIWTFPFMSYPSDLVDDDLAQEIFHAMVTPEDVFKVWEERVNLKNLHSLFSDEIGVNVQVLADDLPFFSTREIIKANSLHYMG